MRRRTKRLGSRRTLIYIVILLALVVVNYLRSENVVLVCSDTRVGTVAGSLGGTYKDIIDIMTEYGAVNACNLDGGSSTVMLYKDTCGKMGAKDEIHMINNYSLLQEEPRRMPTFFMVQPGSED